MTWWRRGTIHLVITDVVMPGMNGLELARRLTAARPGILVLFMSGYSEEAVTQLGVRGTGEAFLQKPVTPSRLSGRVREILSGRGTGSFVTSSRLHAPGATRPPQA